MVNSLKCACNAWCPQLACLPDCIGADASSIPGTHTVVEFDYTKRAAQKNTAQRSAAQQKKTGCISLSWSDCESRQGRRAQPGSGLRRCAAGGCHCCNHGIITAFTQISVQGAGSAAGKHKQLSQLVSGNMLTVTDTIPNHTN